MKTIELTPREYYEFMKLASGRFVFQIELIKDQAIFVIADEKELAKVGY